MLCVPSKPYIKNAEICRWTERSGIFTLPTSNLLSEWMNMNMQGHRQGEKRKVSNPFSSKQTMHTESTVIQRKGGWKKVSSLVTPKVRVYEMCG